jgi:hypothetical protein
MTRLPGAHELRRAAGEATAARRRSSASSSRSRSCSSATSWACCSRSAPFAAWVVIVITGKMPRGLFDLMVLANSYTARSDAYLYLLTETYPPFQDEQTRAAGGRDLTRLS